MKALQEYLNKNKKTDIIFDFDHTIFAILVPWEKLYNYDASLRKKDEKMFNHYTSQHLGWSNYQNALIEKYGKSTAEYLTKYEEKFMVETITGARPNKELIAFIEENKKNFKMYIWSSNPGTIVKTILFDNHLVEHFDKIITRDDVVYVKPREDGFRQINDGKTKLEDYLFVGDSISDEGAAKAIGVDFFKVQF